MACDGSEMDDRVAVSEKLILNHKEQMVDEEHDTYCTINSMQHRSDVNTNQQI